MLGCLFPRLVGTQSPSHMLCMVANLVLDYSTSKDTYIGVIPSGQGFEDCFYCEVEKEAIQLDILTKAPTG
jgi:hypothetical protein